MRDHTYTNTHVVLLVLLLVIVATNSFVIWFAPVMTSQSNDREVADLTLKATIITDARCAQCVDPAPVLDGFAVFGMEFTSVDSLDRVDAGNLIEKYGLTQLPAIIIYGDNELLPQFDVLTRVDDAYVWAKLGPPYIDLDGQVKGLVDFLAIDDESCSMCADPTVLAQQLQGNGMKFATTEYLDVTDAQEIIERYGIEKVPTVVLSADAGEYPWLRDAWQGLGSVASDGSFVLEQVLPPYIELGTNRLRGEVSAILLTDEGCESCVDPSSMVTIFEQNFGMDIRITDSVDVTSSHGKGLLEKYGLSAQPTVILDGEAVVYPGIEQVWSTFGSVEPDGSFVVRDTSAFG